MIKTRKDRCQDTYSPLRLWAGRLLAFLGAGEARREGRAAGVGGAVYVGQGPGRWSAGDVCGGQWSGGNSEVFNQLLTTFFVVAMVWRLTVFFLCSYCLFWRLLGRFRSPGAGRWLADGLGGLRGVVWGCWLLDQERGGVAEKGTVLLRMGVEYCPTSSPPLHGLWGVGKQAGGISAIRA